MANIEDAIKVAGMEGRMTAIDLAELVDKQLVRPVPAALEHDKVASEVFA
jgi:hypothetical protein